MVIIGAKGMAKDLLAVLHWNGEGGNIFLFDNVNPDTPDILHNRFPVIKTWEALERHFSQYSREFALGVGGAKVRSYCFEQAVSIGGEPTSVVSKQALIGNMGVTLGKGTTILPHVIITADVEIGQGSLINTAATIHHDARIGRYCEIAPGARILGRTTIGDRTEIGTNAVVLPDVIIGSGCRIGAGAVVTKDVADDTTVVGIPAKRVGRISGADS